MRQMKKWRKWVAAAVMLLVAAYPCKAQAAQAVWEAGTVYVQMPGFVVEQWAAPRLMLATSDAAVRALAQTESVQIGSLQKGQLVNAWGQTASGWYFVDCGTGIGYVRYEAAAPVDGEQLAQWQAAALAEQQKAQQAAALAEQQKAQQAAALAEQQAAQQAAAQQMQQPQVAAPVVFVGDSRMVTLKEAVEENFGVCPAAVVAMNGARYEWLKEKGVPQADRIIGPGSKVILNLGVNDLKDVEKYLQLVNSWAAVWTARGAQIYYASVNPVWNNSQNITKERVDFFNQRMRTGLIPQVIWLDSNSYLLQHGVRSNDGIHYLPETDLVLYHYYMSMIGMA